MSQKQNNTEPKARIFAEKPGTSPATESEEIISPASEEKVEAEATAKLEEEKQETRVETLQNNDNSGEAG